MDTAYCDGHSQTAKSGVNERPRYYARQLVTPDDMTLEQDYFRAKLRRHNRFLHGWGVVCGARVVPAKQPWMVIVKSGYILSPYGDEICIEKDQCVDVRKKCVSGEPQAPTDDCGCTEAMPAPPPGATLYIAIRYVENKTRLTRVPLGGCGCETSACEFSRYSDGYEICVLDHCPDSHKTPPPITFAGPPPECPECPTEPWVVLSTFTANESGMVTLQECACRRHVASFGNFWWKCGIRDGGVGDGGGHPQGPVTPPTPPTPPPPPGQ
ncbi:MAG: hypothetical protein QOH65_686 [Methylobacteriaceae bacterium]|jgi:hypothetical protein|nr:hypothetical protein [Methylobacteriaceae bacterium]